MGITLGGKKPPGPKRDPRNLVCFGAHVSDTILRRITAYRALWGVSLAEVVRTIIDNTIEADISPDELEIKDPGATVNAMIPMETYIEMEALASSHAISKSQVFRILFNRFEKK